MVCSVFHLKLDVSKLMNLDVGIDLFVYLLLLVD